jgi:surfactin synthase thioesterase subunit
VYDTDPGAWIRRYRPSENAPARLVCFPHAGGSASFYHPVAMAHAPAADVLALQYPGRQDRRHEPLIPTVDEYADVLTDVLAGLPDRPTVFFGHSMGALLGFEVADRLEQRGRPGPSALIASGRRAPGTVRDERVYERDDDGVIAELRQLNGTDSALLGDDEILRMALPAIRNDYRAVETYPPRPGRTVSCPIVALAGTDDPKTTAEEAGRWREHTTGEFRLRLLPGGHFYLSAHQDAVNHEIGTELTKLSLATSRD